MYDEYAHWHHEYWYHMGTLFIVILTLLVVCGVVYVIQSSSKSSTQVPKKEDTAMDTLKKRYAAGEINAEEFERRKKDLES